MIPRRTPIESGRSAQDVAPSRCSIDRIRTASRASARGCPGFLLNRPSDSPVVSTFAADLGARTATLRANVGPTDCALRCLRGAMLRGATGDRKCRTRTVRLNRTAYCHKKTYLCNINGLKDHSTRHQMDVSDQCKTYRKSQGLPLGTFAFRILLKRRGLSLSEFGVRMSQLSPGLLMSVHRTIQTYGPNCRRYTARHR